LLLFITLNKKKKVNFELNNLENKRKTFAKMSIIPSHHRHQGGFETDLWQEHRSVMDLTDRFHRDLESELWQQRSGSSGRWGETVRSLIDRYHRDLDQLVWNRRRGSFGAAGSSSSSARELIDRFHRDLDRDFWQDKAQSHALHRHPSFDFDRFHREIEESMRRHRELIDRDGFWSRDSAGFGLGGAAVGSDAFPKLVDENGQRKLQWNLSVPREIDPSKIKVSSNEREVIVEADDRKETPNSKSHYSLYHRSTLPNNADAQAVQASLNDDRLLISAPINSSSSRYNHIESHRGAGVPVQIGNYHERVGYY
jgi:HSP20 family molecular chaperone IbpA